ncbi:MAG TPA: IS481 family transposase [Azospirillaceae bacterium]|nr:IS481 family transposase [Azospirillaceae bacterium]
MPWQEVSLMERRKEFVRLAEQEGANVSALCRHFGISRKTGYKWLGRAAADPHEAFADRSRRPHSSPCRTPAAPEAAVLALRQAHPSWGGRKIRRRLQDLGSGAVPAASTISAILHRHGRLDPEQAAKHTALRRFEHPHPNALWQMDFKGHFATLDGRCHPLTVLDDHSRYALCLAACANEAGATVRAQLIRTFERYGLPERMTMDNGSPWGGEAGAGYTPLTVWLLRLGIRCSHSRPYHPQTQGKDERFHRTLKAELLQGPPFADLAACQRAFERWRGIYNLERPHEALGLLVPATRYRVSPRSYPGAAPEPVYGPGDTVRRVHDHGWISVRGRWYKLPKAFAGERVALRPTATDGLCDVFFVVQRIAQVDLRDALNHSQPVTHVSEQVSPISPV